MGTIVPNMGTTPDQLSEHLFGKTRAKLLGLLYGQPDRNYYLTELFRMAGVGRGAVQRELARLESLGLVTVRNRGNQKLFQANTRAPIFPELEGLIRKTAGIAGTIAEALSPDRSRIDIAFIFGSVAAGKARAGSDVDLFIVGDVAFDRVAALLMETHDRVGREINPIVMSRDEFIAKREGGDRFLDRVLKQDKVFVEGTPHDIEELARDGSAD